MRILLAGALLAAATAAGLSLSTSTASAQYAWDWRVDPQWCHWRDVCDYGGRAIRYRAYRYDRGVVLRRYGAVKPALRAYAMAPAYATCRVTTVRRERADGSVAVRKERRCV